MMKRILSALILGAAVVYVVLMVPLIPGALVVAAAALIAAHEMVFLLESAGCRLNRKPVLAASILMLGAGILSGPAGLSAGLALGGLLIFAFSPEDGSVKGSMKRASSGFFVLFFPVWCLAHLVFYLQTNEGRSSLMFLLICVWMSDSAAYYAGTAFGRRKLAVKISPNKTIVGSIAGILGSVFSAFLLRWLSLVAWPLPFVLLSGLFLSVVAQAGDLAESIVKRDAGVKDSGELIPGHGGILDRVDALLFSVPMFYYCLSWFQGFLP
jgi:phosphatidate cytidylyltransferase